MDSKRAPLLRSAPARLDRHPFRQRDRPRFDYLQWLCVVAVFFFAVVVFQAFLPGSAVEKSGEAPGLDGFAAQVGLPPLKMMERLNSFHAAMRRSGSRAGLRKPNLAVVLPNLSMDGVQLLMVSLVKFLHELGYSIEVYALESGLADSVWRSIKISVKILQITGECGAAVDWLIYDGVLVNSLEGKEVVSCLLQEPFQTVPLIWAIHETSLALRSRNYLFDWQINLANDWKRAYSRAAVVVFPNYYFPVIYSNYDSGNYFVIPGFSSEALIADRLSYLGSKSAIRADMGYSEEDVVVAIVGSQFSYTRLWVDHTLVLQALLPLLSKYSSHTASPGRIKVGILNSNLTGAYKVALEAIILNLRFPEGSVRQLAADTDFSNFLSIADLVVYGSFFEEQSFPPVLAQAMSLGKPVIAPDLAMIRKQVVNRVNGYLFPKDKMKTLTRILFQLVPNGIMSPVAFDVALMGKSCARNLMVTETLEGYATLLEYILHLPSEVSSPKDAKEIPPSLKAKWHWQFVRESTNFVRANENSSFHYLEKLEKSWNQQVANETHLLEEAFSVMDWEDEEVNEIVNPRKKREDEELMERMAQPFGNWDHIYRSARKADRAKNQLQEIDVQELERTGQPLCIYEPYFGEGTWPFLHNRSLYRGVALSMEGVLRPGLDDINASSRLPILCDPYYRNILGDYGAFFALANRIDLIHKNAWIGFQSWRATARKKSLSKDAEKALLEAIEAQRHGDAFYFWVRMDNDNRNPSQQDFWSFCDSSNSGKCKCSVSEALGNMYRVRDKKWLKLPPMPLDSGSWSVMSSWALTTQSFLEFTMFSRMFVDALDAQVYNGHKRSAYCSLSSYEDRRRCFSRVLELMVNVWAYHSARRIIYVNPDTGAMTEHHHLHSRRGKMWVNWFSFSTLKSMDEDLAEEMDVDKPNRRRLWPSTGEVFWSGRHEKERYQRHQLKEMRKRESRDKILRMLKRRRQQTIGKYVKPLEEDANLSNSTITTNLQQSL